MTGVRDDGTLDWGSSNELNALETVMWRAEVDPALSSTILALEILDEVPDWERFRTAHDWGSRAVPRFRQRVVDGPAGLGQPSWVVDPSFDLDHHVRRVTLPEGATYRDMLLRVRDIAVVPFDRSRAPWQAVLIDGLPDGRVAYALKMHHATLDGMGGMQLLGGLHSRTRKPTAKTEPPLPQAGDTSALGAVTRQAGRDVRGLAGLVRSAPGKVLGIGRPDHAVRDAAAYAASLKRVLGDSGAEPSPLLVARSGDWWFGALDVDWPALKAAGKSVGCSLNDAFMSALLGGFRRYHEELGVPIDTMPFAMPISVRKPDDPAGGNAFAAARLAGPVGERDPVKRMQIVGKAVREVRAEPALNGVGAMAPAIARLPGPVIAQLAGGLTKANDFQASNIPGLRDEVYLAGAKVERMYGFAPLPGCAAMIAMMTHGDVGCVAINLDPAAITEPERLGRCLVEGFTEVLELLPDAPVPVWLV